MIRLLRILSRLAGALGLLLALPGAFGALLLLAAGQLSCLAMSLEEESHARDLYPHDLAPDSEPR